MWSLSPERAGLRMRRSFDLSASSTNRTHSRSAWRLCSVREYRCRGLLPQGKMGTKRQSTRRRWPPTTAALDALTEEATIDANGVSEQRVGFSTMLDEYLVVPFDVEILGATATVERIDMTDDEHIVAVCRRGRFRQAIFLLDFADSDATTARRRVDHGVSAVGALAVAGATTRCPDATGRMASFSRSTDGFQSHRHDSVVTTILCVHV